MYLFLWRDRSAVYIFLCGFQEFTRLVDYVYSNITFKFCIDIVIPSLSFVERVQQLAVKFGIHFPGFGKLLSKCDMDSAMFVEL